MFVFGIPPRIYLVIPTLIPLGIFPGFPAMIPSGISPRYPSRIYFFRDLFSDFFSIFKGTSYVILSGIIEDSLRNSVKDFYLPEFLGFSPEIPLRISPDIFLHYFSVGFLREFLPGFFH